ncbi:hypothetical protein ACERK3_03960 [Phycisphaerales bacterium AB-hyl4]|uniref:Uncharacterized protein n=1 Tax=Natronomicrosphaera hydrolytica TaxID=3242702 RepID=A0ABV4U4M9_9BACT
MATHEKRILSDEELLANATPIEPDEDDEVVDMDELQPIDIDAASEPAPPGRSRRIQTFDTRVPHEDNWQRQPNITGKGAIHVKTFVAKLRLDAVEHMDEQINHWLDAHPEYEVKFVTTSVGKLIGKMTEDAMFVSVWV